MLIIISIMFSGIFLGYLLRRIRFTLINKIITILIWILLFLLGIDVGSNEAIIKGLHTIGLEAFITTCGAVAGSVIFSWGLWHLVKVKTKR